MLMDRDFTPKLISEASRSDLIKYVERLNLLETRYSEKDERYGDAISKNQISTIINEELNKRGIGILCLPV